MKNVLSTMVAALVFAVPQVAYAADDQVDIFFKTCMASVPDFARVGDLATQFGFEPLGEKIWLRKSDRLSISNVQIGSLPSCEVGEDGDHVEKYKTDLVRFLTDKFAGAFEPIQIQSGTLYIIKRFVVRDLNENVIVDVVNLGGTATSVQASVGKN